MTRFLVVLACATALAAQDRRVVRASGDATISARPDQARISVGVITQAETAQAASSQNAAQVDRVLGAIRQILGETADIKTISYNLSPIYRTPSGGGQPVLVGYSVSNMVEVTTNDLNVIGRLIDATTQAGANNVGSPRFTIQEDAPVRRQALTAAAREARTRAEAIAAGLNMRLGGVISAQEGGTVQIIPADRIAVAAPGGGTPVQTGLVEVHASVTVDFELQ